MKFPKKGLRYDDPDFFEKIEKLRIEQLERKFKTGKDVDLDFTNPKITIPLAKRFRQRLENGEISREELKRILEMK